MKGNSPLFANRGNKIKSSSKYSTKPGILLERKPYDNKKGNKLLKRAKTEGTKNFIKQNYRSGAKVGDGSTAAAVRQELKTGNLVGGRSHIIKAQQEAKRIDNILAKNPKHPDRKLLMGEKRKLEKALSTKPNKGGRK